METTLHRQLKALYSPASDTQEVSIGGYRIDAVRGGELIEIQNASLGAIREKVRDLVKSHDVLVVKPLAVRKYLVKRSRKGGKVVSARYSPIRATIYDLFEDLVHFVPVFPHPRLSLEVVLTEQEEHRIEGRSRRAWRRKYRIDDRSLRTVNERLLLKTTDDLLALLPGGLPDPFTTAHLAEAADMPRWLAQKAAFCLRTIGGFETVGKQGNAWLYRKVTDDED